MNPPVRSGRSWAYTGVILGGAVSIAANIAHSFVPPTDAPPDWNPEAGAVVGAIVWPVFLFVAVEILARVVWPTGRTWYLVRWAGILPVALVAALVSYRHLSGLLDHYGEEAIVSILGPLAVDGLMVMATGALIATGRHPTPDSGTEPNTVSVPAPARSTIAGRPAPTPTHNHDQPASEPAAAPELVPAAVAEPAAPRPAVPSPAVLAARITPNRMSSPADRPADPARRKPSPRPRTSSTPEPRATERAPSPTDIPVTASDRAQLTLPIVAEDLLARAAEVARLFRSEHGTPITPGQLAVRLKVTSETAAQAIAQMDLLPDNPTRPIPTVNGRPVKASR